MFANELPKRLLCFRFFFSFISTRRGQTVWLTTLTSVAEQNSESSKELAKQTDIYLSMKDRFGS